MLNFCMNLMCHLHVVQVYLIEVNNCPALYRHGQILTEMLPLVIEEVAQKVSYTASMCL